MVARDLKFQSLSDALNEAERLVSLRTVAAGSKYTLSQTPTHCAQSIEYSMDGYPELKSAFFRNTAGPAAFRVFFWRGKMSHDRNKGIPGAPALDVAIDLERSLARLHSSAEKFQSTKDPLKPHFAYGKLSKPDYDVAHAMHLANHFSEFDV